ncbi:MAG TPA: hypothetical protein VM680_10345 [Verrucomicrobiae bacterium]|nr:hypothetical protein [Verrucomicrobiae bacterium]
MRIMKIAFDPWRGGFSFSVKKPAIPGVRIFDGRFDLYTTTGDVNGPMCAFESFRDRGGYHLNGLRNRDLQTWSESPAGKGRHLNGIYPLAADDSHDGPATFKVKRSPLDISFFASDWPRMQRAASNFELDHRLSVSICLGSIAAVRFTYSALATAGPIEALEFSVEDFK